MPGRSVVNDIDAGPARRGGTKGEPDMIVECATCPVAGQRCEDCVVTVLAGLPVLAVGGELPLDAAERAAVGRFVDAGLLERGYAASLRARAEPRRGARAV